MHGGDAGTFRDHSLHILDNDVQTESGKVLWHLGHGKNYFQRIAYFGPLSQIRLYKHPYNTKALE
jgi:hypothetical protein